MTAKEIKDQYYHSFFNQLDVVNPFEKDSSPSLTYYFHGGYGSGYFDIYQIVKNEESVELISLRTPKNEDLEAQKIDTLSITNHQTGEVTMHLLCREKTESSSVNWEELVAFYSREEVKEMNVDSCDYIWIDGNYITVFFDTKEEWKILENGPCLIEDSIMHLYAEPILNYFE